MIRRGDRAPRRELSAYEVSVVGQSDWKQIVNARSAGKAKVVYFSDLRESWPSIPFIALRVRCLGGPHTSDEFRRVADYRGLPAVRCGQLVRVGDATGVIVGHNGSANFDVLFDNNVGPYSGQVLNVHPASCEFLNPSPAEERPR